MLTSLGDIMAETSSCCPSCRVMMSRGGLELRGLEGDSAGKPQSREPLTNSNGSDASSTVTCQLTPHSDPNHTSASTVSSAGSVWVGCRFGKNPTSNVTCSPSPDRNMPPQ